MSHIYDSCEAGAISERSGSMCDPIYTGQGLGMALKDRTGNRSANRTVVGQVPPVRGEQHVYPCRTCQGVGVALKYRIGSGCAIRTDAWSRCQE